MPCPSLIDLDSGSTLITRDLVPTSVPFDSSAFSAPATSSEFSASPYTIQHASTPRTDDHSVTLSMIAASASSLEAMMPYGERLERHDISGSSITDVNAEAMRHNEEPYDTTAVSTHPSLEAYVNGMGREARDAIITQASQTLRPLAMNIGGTHRYSSAEHANPHGRAQKTRGKLSSSRRQEVQNMRKQGACIRCRMLRKTVCSCHGSHDAPLW